jgi:hypothetical protein
MLMVLRGYNSLEILVEGKGSMRNLETSAAEELYQKVGDIIAASLDAPWDRADLHVEIEEDDHAKIYAEFIPSGKQVGQSLHLRQAYELYVIFEELRKRIHKPGFAHWNKALFSITPDGDFNLRFSYPNSEQ